jgi:hypothetical protein
MPVHLPILFHFNQHLTLFAYPASRACYRGLLRLLRQHRSLPFNIHISGTLVHALKWLDPEPLELIRDGLADGQFELVGSTYAQNVPYASDDWDNARQIALHQRVLEETFGVTPVSFWNPERCWRQSLLPLIADAGYRYTLVEDHILDQAGAAEPTTITSTSGEHTLTIARDDERLKHLFNLAAWFGRPVQLLDYLAQYQEQAACLAYAEDAEAMGLWGWQHKVVPNQNWYHLNELLQLLAGRDDIQLSHLSAVPAPTRDVSPLPDGSAAWMDAALQRADAPYHEDGYRDWFDFNRSSPRLARYREFFGQIRSALQEASSQNSDGPAQSLRRAAEHVYLAHQYEFGCIGIGRHQYRGWEGAAAAWVLLQAAQWASTPGDFIEVMDINHDGLEEIVLRSGRQLVVTTPAGGRLLYWFDLQNGRQYIGNQLAVHPSPYVADARLPAPLPAVEMWLPVHSAPAAAQARTSVVDETAPTRLGRYLPLWVWDGELEPLSLNTFDGQSGPEINPLPSQRRGLVDVLQIDQDLPLDPDEWLAYECLADGITYKRPLADDLVLEKQYRLSSGSVTVNYRFINRSANSRAITLKVISELCPDYSEVVRHGRPALAAMLLDGCMGIENTVTRSGVVVCAAPEAQLAASRPAFLAMEIELGFSFKLGPQAMTRQIVNLQRRSKI